MIAIPRHCTRFNRDCQKEKKRDVDFIHLWKNISTLFLFDGNIVHAFTTRFNLSIVQFIFEQESKENVLDGGLTKLVGIFAETAEGVEVHVGHFKILCRVPEKYLDNDVKESDNDVSGRSGRDLTKASMNRFCIHYKSCTIPLCLFHRNKCVVSYI